MPLTFYSPANPTNNAPSRRRLNAPPTRTRSSPTWRVWQQEQPSGAKNRPGPGCGCPFGGKIQDCRCFPWEQLDYGMVTAIKAWLDDQYAPATVNRYLCAVRRVLKEPGGII